MFERVTQAGAQGRKGHQSDQRCDVLAWYVGLWDHGASLPQETVQARHLLVGWMDLGTFMSVIMAGNRLDLSSSAPAMCS